MSSSAGSSAGATQPADSNNKAIDSRFAHVHTDPRFRKGSAHRKPKAATTKPADGASVTTTQRESRKPKIDARFQSMFTDPKFNTAIKVDRFGGNVKVAKVGEDLKKFYRVDEADNDEAVEDERARQDDDAAEDSDYEGNVMSERAMAPPSSDDDDEASGDDDDLFSGSDVEYAESAANEVDADTLEHAAYHGFGSSSDDDEAVDSSDDIADDAATDDNVRAEEQVPLAMESSTRIALVNMEWDRVRAVDLFVLLHGFLPATRDAQLMSLTVYVSQYGKQRLADEERYGPTSGLYAGGEQEESQKRKEIEEKAQQIAQQLRRKPSKAAAEEAELKQEADEKAADDDSDISDDDALLQDILHPQDDEANDSAVNVEALRSYEIERLRYYYAVAEFDSTETAEHVYQQCDGLEFETSSNTLDLRYIPAEETFDESDVRDTCETVPSGYKPPKQFNTRALQHTKVDLQWDKEDEDRQHALRQNWNAVLGKNATHSKSDRFNTDDISTYVNEGQDGYSSDEGYLTPAIVETSDPDATGIDTDDGEEDDEDRKPKKKRVMLKRKARARYSELLADIQQVKREIRGETQEDEAEDDDDVATGDVTMTFNPELEKKAARIAAVAAGTAKRENEMSTWDRVLEKQRLKRKQQRQEKRHGKDKSNSKSAAADGSEADAESADEAAAPRRPASNKQASFQTFSDDEIEIDEDDPFYAANQREYTRTFFDDRDPRQVAKQQKTSDRAERKAEKAAKRQSEAELELLMMDENANAEDEQRSGYSLKQMLKEKRRKEKAEAKKRKKDKADVYIEEAAPTSSSTSNFDVNLQDSRFTSLFTHPDYHIDKTDKYYKPTEGTEQIVLARQQQRKRELEQRAADVTMKKQQLASGGPKAKHSENTAAPADDYDQPAKPSKSELAALVTNVKRKSHAMSDKLDKKKFRT